MVKIPIKRYVDPFNSDVGHGAVVKTGEFVDRPDEVAWSDADDFYYATGNTFGEQSYYSDVCKWLERNGYEIIIRRKEETLKVIK